MLPECLRLPLKNCSGPFDVCDLRIRSQQSGAAHVCAFHLGEIKASKSIQPQENTSLVQQERQL
jgi:hypothetical protein